ncbi:MAG: hypothetical protein Aurels2KO_01980 [Aureliella sp.]
MSRPVWISARRSLLALVLLGVIGSTGAVVAADPVVTSEFVFAPRSDHNHAPSIVETASGDLICSWYRGSGERKADDVAIYGSRLRAGESTWSEPFLMADREGFPDCNTAMMIDASGKLWLFWPTIIANSWESCITNFRVSSEYAADGCPVWEREGVILMKPDDFAAAAIEQLDILVARYQSRLTPSLTAEIATVRERLSDKLFQRLGWQPRCKPTVLRDGRILLPLYTDTYSLSIMAISDDAGRTWRSGQPTLGFGAIQPSVLERSDGELVAYMRENGATGKVRVSRSSDRGETWGPVELTELPNPGSGLDALRLASGRWMIVYNDLPEGEDDRGQLAIAFSDDEGDSWTQVRHLEKRDSGAYHYPAAIQGADGRIHVVYSYFAEGGKTMKHVAFNEDWLTSQK